MNDGAYEVKGVQATSSPSMDIQVSSNFERLLFDAYGRDAQAVRRLMAAQAQSGSFQIEAAPFAKIKSEFDAYRTGETGTAKEIGRVYKDAGYLLDPHTAVATHAARKVLETTPHVPMVALGTAHPAKFGDAVFKAAGVRAPLPAHLEGMMERKEHFTVLANDQATVERFVKERARAAK
jgi:threonine synthase